MTSIYMRAAVNGYKETHKQPGTKQVTSEKTVKTEEVATPAIKAATTPITMKPAFQSQPSINVILPPQSTTLTTTPSNSPNEIIAPTAPTLKPTAPTLREVLLQPRKLDEPITIDRVPTVLIDETIDETVATTTSESGKNPEAELIEKDEMMMCQTLLHTPLAKIKFTGTTDGCIEKVCKVFKLFIYMVFGRHGIFLGKAQDDRISVRQERAHVEQYENALAHFVSYIAKQPASNVETTTAPLKDVGQTKTEAPLNALHARMIDISISYPSLSTLCDGQTEIEALLSALHARMTDIIIFYPHISLNVLKSTLLMELDLRITAHNKANPKSTISTTDQEQWKNRIATQWNLFGKEKIEERAEAFVNAYAETTTPAFIANHELTDLAHFADSYIALFGEVNLVRGNESGVQKETLRARAVLRLREAVAGKHQEKFAKVLDKMDKDSSESSALANKLVYFTNESLEDDDNDQFVKAVFPPETA